MAPPSAAGATARPQRHVSPASARMPTTATPHKVTDAFCCAVATFLPSTKTICSTTSTPTAPTVAMGPLPQSSIQQQVVRPRAHPHSQRRPRDRRAGPPGPVRADEYAVEVVEEHVVALLAVGGGGHQRRAAAAAPSHARNSWARLSGLRCPRGTTLLAAGRRRSGEALRPRAGRRQLICGHEAAERGAGQHLQRVRAQWRPGPTSRGSFSTTRHRRRKPSKLTVTFC